MLTQGNKLHLFDTGIILPNIPTTSRTELLSYKFGHSLDYVALYKIKKSTLQSYQLHEDLPEGWCYTGPLLWNNSLDCVNAYDTEEWDKLLNFDDPRLVFHGQLASLDILALPHCSGNEEAYLLKTASEVPLKLFHEMAVFFD